MNENPMGRQYTREEWAAARRQDIAGDTGDGGALIFATGPYWPTKAHREAHDWKLLADAMDREWQKPLPEHPSTGGHQTEKRD